MRSYSAEEQIERLGIGCILEENSDMRVLDIGCGEDPILVDYLLSKGIESMGVDPRLGKEGMHYIKKEIRSTLPGIRSLELSAQSYDLVVAHQNDSLQIALSCFSETSFLRWMWGKDYEMYMENARNGAEAIIPEMLRVAKKDGIIVIQPGLDLMEQKMKSIIYPEGWSVQHKEAEGVEPSDGIISFGSSFGSSFEDCSTSVLYRTILYTNQLREKFKGVVDTSK